MVIPPSGDEASDCNWPRDIRTSVSQRREQAAATCGRQFRRASIIIILDVQEYQHIRDHEAI
jgi:hypothetical protein